MLTIARTIEHCLGGGISGRLGGFMNLFDADSLFEGLECVIGRARVTVPIEAVNQVIEYPVAPAPPLSHPWVGGLGVYDGEVLISVALAQAVTPDRNAQRMAKGVLLHT